MRTSRTSWGSSEAWKELMRGTNTWTDPEETYSKSCRCLFVEIFEFVSLCNIFGQIIFDKITVLLFYCCLLSCFFACVKLMTITSSMFKIVNLVFFVIFNLQFMFLIYIKLWSLTAVFKSSLMVYVWVDYYKKDKRCLLKKMVFDQQKS